MNSICKIYMLGLLDCIRINCIENRQNDYIIQNPILFDYEHASVPIIKELEPLSIDINDLKNQRNIENNDQIAINLLDGVEYHATSPSLLVKYLFIDSKNYLSVDSNCSSQVFFIIKGNGELTYDSITKIKWKRGDVFVFPKAINLTFLAYQQDSIILMIDDSPLLNYLGTVSNKKRFNYVKYDGIILKQFVLKGLEESNVNLKNRNGVLLSNEQMVDEKLNTISHTMWCLLNVTRANTSQKPHRHTSIALDFCVSAEEKKVYTIMGKELNPDGTIKDPIKIYWKTDCMFVTPPGWWHSHVNESHRDAWVFPIQDAGLHTYLRTLDIQFVK